MGALADLFKPLSLGHKTNHQPSPHLDTPLSHDPSTPIYPIYPTPRGDVGNAGDVGNVGNGSATAAKYHDLFRSVSEISNNLEAENAFEQERRVLASFAERIASTQDALLESILDAFGEKVLEGAREGARSVELLVFDGADTMDDFSLLFMVKGPRDRVHREQMRAIGFQPLLRLLQKNSCPFAITHRWYPGTTKNSIIASW